MDFFKTTKGKVVYFQLRKRTCLHPIEVQRKHEINIASFTSWDLSSFAVI